MTTQRTHQILITVGFCLFLLAGLLLHLLSPDLAFSATEKRPLQAFTPPLPAALVSGRFMTDFERYANDQFPFRPFFVGLKSESERALGKRDNGRVWFGRDAYLFEKKTQLPDVSFHAKSLAAFAESMQATHPAARRFLLIAPTAAAALPDKLPASAPAVDQRALLDGLYAASGAYTIVDTLPALSQDPAGAFYYRNDHHWTSAGARTAYRTWAAAAGFEPVDGLTETVLTDRFLGTTYAKAAIFFPKPDSLSVYRPADGPDPNDAVELDDADGRKIRTGLYDLGQVNAVDPYLVFVGQNDAYLRLETTADTDRTLVLIKDSYANSMLPFLTHHYKTIHVIDLRYHSGSLRERLAQAGRIDDILVCYNLVTFAEDTNLYRLTR